MIVKVTLDDEVKVFEDVSKVNCDMAFDMFENVIEIYQGKKKTKIKQYQIIDMCVEDK